MYPVQTNKRNLSSDSVIEYSILIIVKLRDFKNGVIFKLLRIYNLVSFAKP